MHTHTESNTIVKKFPIFIASLLCNETDLQLSLKAHSQFSRIHNFCLGKTVINAELSSIKTFFHSAKQNSHYISEKRNKLKV